MATTSDRICIIGQGYVGLTLTAIVAQSGNEVLGIEKDEQKLALLQQGESHLDEPGLEKTIRTQMRLGTLEFEQSLTAANFEDCNAYNLAVGSPLDSETNTADLSMLRAAISSVADNLEPGDTVIIRSTISIGTARDMADRLAKQSGLTAGEDFYLAQAPERTVQGAALEEIQSLPQIVGGYNERSVDNAEQILNNLSDTLIKVAPL